MTSSDALLTKSPARQYWQRIDPTVFKGPRRQPPWLWCACLLIIFLFGLFITTPRIEQEIRDGVATTLARSGHEHLSVTADGQHVEVRGVGTSNDIASDIATIHAIARGTVCQVWFLGNYVCPAQVHVSLQQRPDFGEVKSNPEASGDAPIIPAELEFTTAPNQQFHNFSIIKNEDLLTLNGDVPTPGIRDLMLKQATAVREAVVDELTVTGASSSVQFPWAVERAWSILPYLKSGAIHWQDGLFAVTGTITSDQQEAIKAAYDSQFFAKHLAGLNLEVTDVYNDVTTCNNAFSEVLNLTPISFDPQSAALTRSSTPVLERLAVLASTCTLRFVIGGHTDDMGDQKTNLILSEARANAVKTALISRGIEAERLTATGYGSSKPVKTNQTPQGRMKNRRITITAQP